jgi:flagellar biosynthesis protein FlhF
MNAKRFKARDMRTALTLVREKLGEDAIILSNKRIEGGVEIIATSPTIAEDVAASNHPSQPDNKAHAQEIAKRLAQKKQSFDANKLASEPKATPAPKKRQSLVEPEEHDEVASLFSDHFKAQLEEAQQERFERSSEQPVNNHYAASEQQAARTQRPARPKPQPRRPQPPYEYSEDDFVPPQASFGAEPQRDDPALVAMREEMRFLRSMLENQLSGLAWKDMETKDPMKVMMSKKLLDYGFSNEVAEKVVAHLNGVSNEREAWLQAMTILRQFLPTTDDDIIAEGGVVALLGATGVGKTTTIAKLAARYTLRYGPDDVALISTDSYRIAAHEQLKTYGRILGCTVRVVDTPEALSRTLDQLYDKRLILIDTAGMSQRDIRLPKQLAGLRDESIRSYLVMSSTAQRKVLEETIRAFKGIDISGTILTKLDETMSLGESLSAVIKHRMPVSYITNGQRVPEDMEIASSNLLVKLLNQTHKSESKDWKREMVA